MKKMRFFPFFLACLMAVSLLSGCQEGNKAAAGTSSADASSSAVSSVEPGLYLDGELAEVTEPVLTIENQFEVGFDEYRYYFMSLKNSYSSTTWDASQQESLKNNVVTALKNNYAVDLLAADNGITLTPEDEAAIDQEIAATADSLGGDADYQNALAQINATEGLYRTMLLHDRLQSRLLYALYGDTLRDSIQEDYVRVKHVLLSFPDGETDHTATKQKAEEVLQKAKAGEDFDKLVAEYGEDPGMVSNLDGYYFTTGKMVEEFEEASFALQPGEISDLVETSYGYHIILRLDMEEEYIKNHFAEFVVNYGDTVTDYNNMIEEKVNEMEVSYGSQYEVISVETLK